MPNVEPMRLLRIRQVEDLIGLKKSSIYNMISAGEFPRPVSVGPRVKCWRAEDIAAWIDGRPYTKSAA
jgi:prophage regulatory protein